MPTRGECPDTEWPARIHPKGEACDAVPLFLSGTENMAGWVTVDGKRRCPGCKQTVIAAIRQAQAMSNEDHGNLGLQATRQRRGMSIYRDRLDEP